MHLEDPLNKLVLLDRLESQNASGGDILAWNLDAWVGRDLDKLWIRSEGERQSGDTERAELELLYGRGLWPWWDLVAGARIDFAPAGDQSWAAVGVRGLTPYRFDVEATAYLGSGGRAALRLETTYELLVTNRLILEPLLELNWHGQTDAVRGVGAWSPTASSASGCATKSGVRSPRTSAWCAHTASVARPTWLDPGAMTPPTHGSLRASASGFNNTVTRLKRIGGQYVVVVI